MGSRSEFWSIIDRFHNRDLFYKDNDMSFRDREVEIYQDDLLYIKLSETNPTYLLKIISALNNFKAYLSDDKVEINYEYIWDIICMPQTGKNNELGGSCGYLPEIIV